MDKNSVVAEKVDEEEEKEEYEDDVDQLEDGAGSHADIEKRTEFEDDQKKDTEESGQQKRRVSARNRKLTAKVRENKEQEIVQNFWKWQNKFAELTHSCAERLKEELDGKVLIEIKNRLNQEFNTIDQLYNELRALGGPPDTHLRRVIDQLQADRDSLIATVSLRISKVLKQEEEKMSKCSSSYRSRSSRSSGSRRSQVSAKMVEAAANAAAHRAELQACKEEAKRAEELEQLQILEAKRRSEAEAVLQQKRRELEEQRITKLLQMEDAKLKVYSEELEERSHSKLFVRCPKTERDTSPEERRLEIPEKKHIPECVVEDRVTSPEDSFGKLAAALTASVRCSNLPTPEPFIFDGNPLTWQDWSLSFKMLIEDRAMSELDKLYYLKRYITGPAREAVSGFLLMTNESAFKKAREVLEQRFGSSFVITEAFRDRLETWPKISGRDAFGLRRFADFLNQCKVAMTEMEGLNILNDNRENRKMLQKLPDWVTTRWTRLVYESKRTHGRYPLFEEFANFIHREAEIVCDPVVSIGAVKTPQEHEKSKLLAGKKYLTANTLATSNALEETERTYCLCCKREGHHLAGCWKFAKKPPPEREDFIKKGGLCFGCLKAGHLSKHCKQKSTCKTCGKKHPTSLHRDVPTGDDGLVEMATTHVASVPLVKDEEEAGTMMNEVFCGKTVGAGGKCQLSSMIVPVWVSSPRDPNHRHMTYALLDSQSDTSFITEDLAENLDAPFKEVSLRLTTMTSTNKSIQCKRYYNLKLQGLNCQNTIQLPTAYTRESIPANSSHIPTPDTAKVWPHLMEMAHKLAPLQDTKIGLLLGYDCPQALAPKEVVSGSGTQPFAIETELGWSVVGGEENQEASDFGISHRILLKEQRKSDGGEMAATWESRDVEFGNFKDVDLTKKDTMSQDVKPLDCVGSIVHREDEYYEMPLPFETRPEMPNNQQMAWKRFMCLQKRPERDPKYRKHYETSMADPLERGEAARVPIGQLGPKAGCIAIFFLFLLLFTCWSSRADHIEMLDDLSSDAFITGLRGFTAVRGKIQEFLKTQDCEYVPAASHMGGIWERQIRTIKNVLQGILMNMMNVGTRIDSATSRTVLLEAMTIVNSRPLTVENIADPTGPEPLTPNQLLTMKFGVIAPSPPGVFEKEDLYARKRWSKVQYLTEQFWICWRKKYFASLQVRQKWNYQQPNVGVGDIVLLKEDGFGRGQWRLARVVEVFPSQDQLIRKVKILMGNPCLNEKGKSNGKPVFLERPINKLLLLVKQEVTS